MIIYLVTTYLIGPNLKHGTVNFKQDSVLSSESHRRSPPSSTAVLLSTKSVHRASSRSHPEPPTTWLNKSKASISLSSSLWLPRRRASSIYSRSYPTDQNRHRKKNLEEKGRNQKPATRGFESLHPSET